MRIFLISRFPARNYIRTRFYNILGSINPKVSRNESMIELLANTAIDGPITRPLWFCMLPTFSNQLSYTVTTSSRRIIRVGIEITEDYERPLSNFS